MNQKGGVSKTTTAVNLAAALGQKGHRVLLIDLDKSTGASSALGVPPTYEGTYEVMLGAAGIDEVTLRWDDEELDDVTLPKNVDMVSSRRVLEGLEADLREKNKFADPVMTLGREIERVAGGYDFVIADTAPDVSCPTLASYQIFRWFIVAAVPQRLAVEGIDAALADLTAVKQSRNPAGELLGVCMGMVDGKRTRLNKIEIENVQAGLPWEAGLFSVIEKSTVVGEAQNAGQPVGVYAPKHKNAAQWAKLADEVIERLKQRKPKVL